jgi:hypothetical protein
MDRKFTLTGEYLGPDGSGDVRLQFVDQNRGPRQLPIAATSPTLTLHDVPVEPVVPDEPDVPSVSPPVVPGEGMEAPESTDAPPGDPGSWNLEELKEFCQEKDIKVHHWAGQDKYVEAVKNFREGQAEQ